MLRGDLGEVDGGLECLDLAEEEAPFAAFPGPVLEQVAGDGRDADATALPPLREPLTDLVDELIRLDPLGRPLGRKLELRTLLLWRRDRDEVRADAARLDRLVRDAVIAEAEMPRRLAVGGVQDGVLDDGWRQIGPFPRGLSALDRNCGPIGKRVEVLRLRRAHAHRPLLAVRRGPRKGGGQRSLPMWLATARSAPDASDRLSPVAPLHSVSRRHPAAVVVWALTQHDCCV